MDKKIRLIFAFLSIFLWGFSQIPDSIPVITVPAEPVLLNQDTIPGVSTPLDSTLLITQDTIPESEIPEIVYSVYETKYVIQDIKVTGADNYPDYALIALSQLKVGDEIPIPGDEISDATRHFWRQNLFANVKILATRMVEGKVWLEIRLEALPRIADITYTGVKKSERTDIDTRLNLRKGSQVTSNIKDRAKILIKKYFDDKGYKNVDVDFIEKPVPGKEGEVDVIIHIDKNEKTKIQNIFFEGNEMLTDFQLKRAMKKTNERFSMMKRFRTSWMEFFSAKKFTTTEYENDKRNLIDKYNEFGYRDAVITADSVIPYNQKRVNIYLSIDEGNRFYLKDLRIVGNTVYPTEYIEDLIDMKPGDIYNQKKLIERIQTDEDAVASTYSNEGYMFIQVDPVELEVVNDSISLEVRILEGPQARINRVIINGNDRLYEDIVRRELRTKPGELFSREELMRSMRELAQTGHFDPETMSPDLSPNQDNGTVDLSYNLTSKGNDKVELSLGWGQTGVIGRVGLQFTNFSMKNLVNTKTYKGIIPQGEGQTFSISGQTNAQYYQAYSVSFMDPWFGGKRPNMFSVSAYFSRYTDINRRYYNQMQSQYLSSMYSNPYYGYGGYGYGYGGYGYGYGGGYDYSSYYESAYDKSKYMQILGFSLGYGKRLTWPDDFFQLMATLNYQMYMLHNWENSYYLGVSENGNYHDINLELNLQRNSIDAPLYTRTGSQFLLSASSTFPYSLVESKDYSTVTSDAEKYKLVEYYKIKFMSKTFIPLMRIRRLDREDQVKKRTPVLMSRVEVGWIGDYNKFKKSPFGTYYVGGDGMTGGYSYYQETVALRGYDNGEIAGNNYYMPNARAYTRLSLELRYPLILEPSSTIYALLFTEAGDAWNSIGDFKPFNLKRSAGIGARIFLPMVGLMGIDWAYGFDRPYGSANRGGSNFHFILGQEF